MRWVLRSRPPLSAGFTLLEITMVLFIIVLFFGVAAMSFEGLTKEQALRKPASELEYMAREAVRRAGMYEEPQFIVFDKGGFAMRYRADAQATGAGDNNQMWLRQTQIPPRMTVKLKRWGSREWQPAAGQQWEVLPSGLCEPISVRMEMDRSFIEMEFNPLTGGIADQTMNIAGP